jgi:hypothetical protein
MGAPENRHENSIWAKNQTYRPRPPEMPAPRRARRTWRRTAFTSGARCGRASSRPRSPAGRGAPSTSHRPSRHRWPGCRADSRATASSTATQPDPPKPLVLVWLVVNLGLLHSCSVASMSVSTQARPRRTAPLHRHRHQHPAPSIRGRRRAPAHRDRSATSWQDRARSGARRRPVRPRLRSSAPPRPRHSDPASRSALGLCVRRAWGTI